MRASWISLIELFWNYREIKMIKVIFNEPHQIGGRETRIISIYEDVLPDDGLGFNDQYSSGICGCDGTNAWYLDPDGIRAMWSVFEDFEIDQLDAIFDENTIIQSNDFDDFCGSLARNRINTDNPDSEYIFEQYCQNILEDTAIDDTIKTRQNLRDAIKRTQWNPPAGAMESIIDHAIVYGFFTPVSVNR